MKNNVDFDFNGFDIRDNQKSKKVTKIEKYSLFFFELFNSFSKMILCFLPISVLLMIFFSYYSHPDDEVVLNFFNLWDLIFNYFRFIFSLFYKSAFCFDFRIDEFRVFFPVTFYSFLLSGLLVSNFSFFDGYSRGIKKSFRFISLRKEKESLERNIFEEKLMKMLEDIKGSFDKLQYNFFQFVKNNEKSNEYGEFERKVSDSEIDQVNRKISNLESSLDKLNLSIFELGITITRKINNNPRFFKKKINYNSNSNLQNKEGKNSEI